MQFLLSRAYTAFSFRPKVILFAITSCAAVRSIYNQPSTSPTPLSYIQKVRSLSTIHLLQAALLTDLCRLLGRIDCSGSGWIVNWAVHRKADLLADADDQVGVVVEVVESGLRVKDVVDKVNRSGENALKAVMITPGRMVNPALLTRVGRALVAGQSNWMRYVESLNRVQALPWADPMATAKEEDVVLFDRLVAILAYLCEATSTAGVELVLCEWHLSERKVDLEESRLQSVALLHIALCLARAFAPRETPFAHESKRELTVRLSVEWSAKKSQALHDILEESPLKEFANQVGLRMSIEMLEDLDLALASSHETVAFSDKVIAAPGLQRLPVKSVVRDDHTRLSIEYRPGIGDLQLRRLRSSGKQSNYK